MVVENERRNQAELNWKTWFALGNIKAEFDFCFCSDTHIKRKTLSDEKAINIQTCFNENFVIVEINSYIISKPIEGTNVVILYLYAGTINCTNTLFHATGYYVHHKIFFTVESKTNYKLVLCFKCNLTLQYSFYNAINASYEYTITY